MRVWNGIRSYPQETAPAVATIGNYDGVHCGHQAILDSVVRSAREKNLPSLLITFEPHPLAVVAEDRRPALLQTRGQKLTSLEAAGLERILILEFDRTLARLSGEEFFTRVLDGRVPLVELHVGTNFRFGHDRAGDVALLERLGRDRGIGVVGHPPIEVDDQVVSSSVIRTAVDRGEVELARRMLGRPFTLVGKVIRGSGRGTDLHAPTANLAVENERLPRPGVYITEAVVLATRSPALTNVGVRPTFGGGPLQVETHLLDHRGDLYGEKMEVRFLARLRDEKKYDHPDLLADQIARDRAAAVAYFENQPA